MSNPMSAAEFVALLDKWGIKHEENRPNWQNHNRNSKGPWGPVNGIGNHHTGGNDDKGGADVLWNGYGDLPGPLCHAGIRQNGTVLLNGWGRVNHFGLGDANVYNHVVMEDYGNATLHPRVADMDGNPHFYGFEWMYDGTVEPETHFPKLYQTAVRVNAAICTHHGWTELSSIAHGEWQPGKWDPGHAKGKLFDCSHFRSHVHQAMKEGPKPPTKTPPPSKPPVTKPPVPPVKPPVPKPTTQVITVVKGDTLLAIAKKYGVTLEKLITDNPSIVQVGDKLTVPKK